MMTTITPHNVIEQLLTDELIVQSYVYSDKTSKYWKIQRPLKIILSNGKVIRIHRGFTYDLSTVPKWLWSLVRPVNDGLFGYLIHDFLYIKKPHGLSRKECDREMLFWTNIVNSNKVDNYVRYFFVRLLGWWVWFRVWKKVKEFFSSK